MHASSESVTPRLAAQRLAELWQRGRQPDVREFLAGAGPLSPVEVVAVLSVDQQQRWRCGERPKAESYLALHPAVHASGDGAVDLVYGEYLLREELGEAPAVDEYLRRFPQFREALCRQIELHQALHSAGDVSASPALTRHVGPRRPLGSSVTPPQAVGPSLPPVFDGYEMLGELGRGGMGIVYKARHLALNRLVALKLIRAGGPGELARFRIEAEAAAQLQHPNIVQIHEVGQQYGQP
jgi:eukaryotic-like serine/threonine-protein kinase